MNKTLTLEEAIRAAIDGKQLQFHTRGQWVDSNSNGKVVGLIMHVVSSREFHWRIKPDAFEEAWDKCISGYTKIPDDKSLARYFWNAAMEHKQ